jgi:hypothetical protein
MVLPEATRTDTDALPSLSPHPRIFFVSQSYGLFAPDSINCSGKKEHAHEGSGYLLVAGHNNSPLLQSRPEPLGDIVIVVDPVRARDQRLVPPRRRLSVARYASDVLEEAVTGIATIGHNPAGHTW